MLVGKARLAGCRLERCESQIARRQRPALAPPPPPPPTTKLFGCSGSGKARLCCDRTIWSGGAAACGRPWGPRGHRTEAMAPRAETPSRPWTPGRNLQATAGAASRPKSRGGTSLRFRPLSGISPLFFSLLFTMASDVRGNRLSLPTAK